MPLLRKKPFVALDLPEGLTPDEEVFMNPLTKEIFRDYEEYFRRSILCNSLVWSCEYTGRANLTLAEALKSETEASDHLSKMPIPLQQAICYIIYNGQVSSLTAFVDEVLTFYRTRYLIGELVEIAPPGKNKSSPPREGVITDILLDKGADYNMPGSIQYKCRLLKKEGEGGDDSFLTVTGDKLCRGKHTLTRERVKLLAKCSAKKITTDPPLYAIKPEHVERLKLDENYNIPYITDYGKPNPRNSKKRKRDTEEGANDKKKKKKEKKRIEATEEAIRLATEERRRLIEEERIRKRKERQEEKEQQRKMQLAEQAFLKEWMRPREDLELTDSRELPEMNPARSLLPNSLFGDLVQVSEFFCLFGEHIDFEEEFPEGLKIGRIEQSIVNSKQGGLFGDLVIFLLKLVFALQEEEDEEERKYAEKYNFTHTEPSLNLSTVTMVPLVTWDNSVPRVPDRPLWSGPAAAYYFTRHYLGNPLHKMQLDGYTVTEILRLHILGVGGRNSGPQYYGRWRFNHRGMYADVDSPCVELRHREPSLLQMLEISNIYDLPAASKLTILSTLINEILTYAQFREIIEEAIDGSREACRDWKNFGHELQKKEREEAASRYKEWLASRIRVKEEKKKKGRLSELQGGVGGGVVGGDSTPGDQSDRSLVETDTSLNLDVSTIGGEDTKTQETRDEEKKANDAQDQALYLAFKELSHKVKARPLGTDRYFRRYWSFFSTPGIFVEESSVDIESLYMRTSPICPPPASPPHTILTNGGNHDALIEELAQKKLAEANDRHGPAPSTFDQLCETPGFGALLSAGPKHSWCHLGSEEEIGELVAALNPRGERESRLIENISTDIGRIVKGLGAVNGEAENGEAGEEGEEKDQTERILDTASSEKLLEATVREQISDLENRIFEASFGGGVTDRIQWRAQLEDFSLDEPVAEDRAAVPPPIERLLTTSRARSASPVTRTSTLSHLTQALLAVEQNLPPRYLTAPLAGKAGKGPVTRWRQSVLACSSLSQIMLHLYVLDSSILWNKSALRASCRVCRRKNDPEKLLLCDGCDRGQHLYCMKPKLRSIPVGEWYCGICQPEPLPEKRRRRPPRKVSEEEEEEVTGEDPERTEEITGRSRRSATPKKPLAPSEKLKLGLQILEDLQGDENGWPFLYPVDGEEVPHYYTIIPNPMDLSTVEKKLRGNRYRKFETFLEDVELIFLNCFHFNTTKAPAHRAGVKLQRLFHQRLDEYKLR